MTIAVGKAPVQGQLVYSKLGGLDGSSIERHLLDKVRSEMAAHEKGRLACTRIDEHCSEWNVETKCVLQPHPKLATIVCSHRLTASGETHVELTHSTLNFMRCGDTLRYIRFEIDVCPAMVCLPRLQEALVRQRLSGPDQTTLGGLNGEQLASALEAFVFDGGEILFLMGDKAGNSLDVDDRFEWWNVATLPLSELVRVAPSSAALVAEILPARAP